MKSKQERDKFLTKVIFGGCWHEDATMVYAHVHYCNTCSKQLLGPIDEVMQTHRKQYDFSSAEGFFKLWRAVQKKDWWSNFVTTYLFKNMDSKVMEFSMAFGVARTFELIDPDVLADRVYAYLRENE